MQGVSALLLYPFCQNIGPYDLTLVERYEGCVRGIEEGFLIQQVDTESVLVWQI